MRVRKIGFRDRRLGFWCSGVPIVTVISLDGAERDKRSPIHHQHMNTDMMETTKTRSHPQESSEVCRVVAENLAKGAIRTCSLRPHPRCSLFVAWNGVLVLVYQGYPPALVAARQCIEHAVPTLRKENFGSKWPKTTLAAVRGEAAQDLSLKDAELLKRICMEYSQRIASEKEEIGVHSLSAVDYHCRSLEELRSRIDVALTPSGGTDDSLKSPDADQREIVDSVVAEWSGLTQYLAKMNAPGSDITSYREKSPAGSTCVAFLSTLPDTLEKHLKDFQSALDKQFPGRYAWLDTDSLHCTLRSLDQM